MSRSLPYFSGSEAGEVGETRFTCTAQPESRPAHALTHVHPITSEWKSRHVGNVVASLAYELWAHGRLDRLAHTQESPCWAGEAFQGNYSTEFQHAFMKRVAVAQTCVLWMTSRTPKKANVNIADFSKPLRSVTRVVSVLVCSTDLVWAHKSK